jgi:hypothetical protein
VAQFVVGGIVPEPATYILLIPALATVTRCRRRFSS